METRLTHANRSPKGVGSPVFAIIFFICRGLRASTLRSAGQDAGHGRPPLPHRPACVCSDAPARPLGQGGVARRGHPSHRAGRAPPSCPRSRNVSHASCHRASRRGATSLADVPPSLNRRRAAPSVLSVSVMLPRHISDDPLQQTPDCPCKVQHLPGVGSRGGTAPQATRASEPKLRPRLEVGVNDLCRSIMGPSTCRRARFFPTGPPCAQKVLKSGAIACFRGKPASTGNLLSLDGC